MKYLLIAGLCAFLFGLYWPNYYTSVKQQGVLATIVSSKGSNEWVIRTSLAKKSPQKSSQIHFNESLSTGTDGEMIIRFKRGAEIKLLPSSFLTLSRKANATFLALRRGEVEVIREGENNSVLISHNGQEKSLQDYRAKSLEEPLWIDPLSLDTVKTVTTITSLSSSIEGTPSMTDPVSIPPTPAKDLELSKDPLKPITESQIKDFQTQVRTMISDRIAKQRNHFYRCYTALIQKLTPKNESRLEGKVDIHFTVNNYGKVEDALVAQSEIIDEKFKSCLLQVVKRTDFQPFQGQVITTLLPLRFDKDLL